MLTAIEENIEEKQKNKKTKVWEKDTNNNSSISVLNKLKHKGRYLNLIFTRDTDQETLVLQEL